MCKRTQRGTLKPPILLGNIQENAFNVNFEADPTDELSNWDHEAKEILPTGPNVILLEAPPPPRIVKKGVEWVKEGLKLSYKVGKCKELYVTKWILIVHLKRVYKFIAEKGKPRCPLTCERGLQHQNHLVTNAHILSDVQFILQQNE